MDSVTLTDIYEDCDALMALDGHYARLWRAQARQAEELAVGAVEVAAA